MRRSIETTTNRTLDLPQEFYASQVDALFSDVVSLLIGTLGACGSVLTVGLRTQSFTLYGIAAALALLSVARIRLITRYRQRRQATGISALRHWERRYQLGAAAQVAFMAIFCLVTFATTTDPLDRMLGLTTVVAYMAGIPGRNFANATGVKYQIICGSVPLTLSIIIAGHEYFILLFVILVPFFIGLESLARRLRGIFVQATVKAHEYSLLAGQFDTALNNMSHGVAMFDEDYRVIVYNAKFLYLMTLRSDLDCKGKSIADLLKGQENERLAALQAYMATPNLGALEIDMPDASLELTFQTMNGGGAVVMVQDITERKRAEERINQLARFDGLTGLNNRTQFMQLMEVTLSSAAPGSAHALLFIDLDQFKQVNDTLGHSRGDLLICEVAARLRTRVSRDTIIARFGGDEFVALLRIGSGENTPQIIAAHLIEGISQPYFIDGHQVVIGASVGIALFPEHDVAPDQLLKKSDMALYRAKAEGRGSYRVFEPSMAVQAKARSELEFDLRHALQDNEFELYYQPIYNMKSRRFTVCEALLRWRHPVRGLVSPGEFIPIAEEMGLIVDIGNWVLRQACLDCASWPSNVAVAVNISPLQFRRGDIVRSVSSALQNAALPARRLELELTESVLLQDVAFTSVTMNLLHIQQVGISLDDFGTGYSSLSYLDKLPLKKIKIDRSFLAQLGTNEKTMLLLRGLTRLSAELGLCVVVEGVETEEQLALIRTVADVDELQGFLFSRPKPAHEIQDILRADALMQAPNPKIVRLAK